MLFRAWTVSWQGWESRLAWPGPMCSPAEGTSLGSTSRGPPFLKLRRDQNPGWGGKWVVGEVGNTVRGKQNINFKARHCQLVPADLGDSRFGQESKKQKH